MRTTLDLNDKLLARAKAAAARDKSTLTRFIEEALALRLRGRHQRVTRKFASLPVYQGSGGLAAGIDACSNKSLFDTADDFT